MKRLTLKNKMIVEIRKNLRFLTKEQLINIIIHEQVKPLDNEDVMRYAERLYEGLIDGWVRDENDEIKM